MNGDMNGNRKLFWKDMRKGREMQQNKGWKWEYGPRRG